jgi:hypothetical protein
MTLPELCSVMLASLALLLVAAVRVNEFLWSDGASLASPFALWIALTFTQLRMKSLSNLVELFALFAFVSLCFGLRVFLPMGTARHCSARAGLWGSAWVRRWQPISWCRYCLNDAAGGTNVRFGAVRSPVSPSA